MVTARIEEQIIRDNEVKKRAARQAAVKVLKTPKSTKTSSRVARVRTPREKKVIRCRISGSRVATKTESATPKPKATPKVMKPHAGRKRI